VCFQTNSFSSFLLLVLIANQMTAPFHLRALCYATFRDAGSLCESGIHYEYNTFSLSQGLYHRLRHFRLTAGTEG
jgi:hypothetical protein